VRNDVGRVERTVDPAIRHEERRRNSKQTRIEPRANLSPLKTAQNITTLIEPDNRCPVCSGQSGRNSPHVAHPACYTLWKAAREPVIGIIRHRPRCTEVRV
jgi:hypothetical protein